MPSKPYPRVQPTVTCIDYRTWACTAYTLHRIARPLNEVCLLGYGHVVKGFSPGER